MTQPGPVVAPPTKTPAPLSATEKRWTIALLVVGAVILAAVLVWFAGSTGGELLSKETKTTGTGATQVVEAKEYSDTVLLAALGVSAAFVLAGAFYGRIREIKLPGGAGIVVGDMPEDDKQVVDQKIDEVTQARTADDEDREVMRRVAGTVARAQYVRDMAARPTMATSSSYLQQLGERSVGEAQQILDRQ